MLSKRDDGSPTSAHRILRVAAECPSCVPGRTCIRVRGKGMDSVVPFSMCVCVFDGKKDKHSIAVATAAHFCTRRVMCAVS